MKHAERSLGRHADDAANIPTKANRVLYVILVGMLLIILRIWHLCVIQYDEMLEESRKPQRKIVLEPAKRATIRDRFNIPLAINKVQYNVSILYSQIKQIPSISKELNQEGKQVKKFKRKEYIAELSNLLGKELDMDSERIADLIHAKASFYHQIPFILKEDISEREYYRLKMFEKDWLGIHVERVPRRHYPMGKMAGDIIGYMGPINRKEYEKVIREIKDLETYIEADEAGDFLPLPANIQTLDDAKQRLIELQGLAYTLNDAIGKAGIEGRFERLLRGSHGKKNYYSDAKGNFLRELPESSEPLAGKRLLLTISAELQEFAEMLLIQNEEIRLTKLSRLEGVKKTIFADKDPWIKGGAIVAIDPNNGEILAMASHPRYDPNDFIASGNIEISKKRKENVVKWLECENYIVDIWNGKSCMEREKFNRGQGIYLEELPMTWSNYLNLVLSANSPLKGSALFNGTIRDAVQIQKHFDGLLNLFPSIDAYAVLNALYKGEGFKPHGKPLSPNKQEWMEKQLELSSEKVKEHKYVLDYYLGNLKHAYDQLLLIDLVHVAVSGHFSDDLLQAIGHQSLHDYRKASTAIVKIQEAIKKMAKELFHDLKFKKWRKENEREYLKKQRAEEKENHRHSKPYIDLLDAIESQMFQVFWEKNQWRFLIAFLLDFQVNSALQDELALYYEHFHEWHREIIHGAHQRIEWVDAFWILYDSLKHLNPELAIEYLQTLRHFEQLNRPLLGQYPHLRRNADKSQIEKHLAAAFYPKFGYGYGRSYAFRQAATQGSIFKLVTAYQALVQGYNKIEKEQVDLSRITLKDLNPLEMVDTVYYKDDKLYVGYGPDGTPLSRYYKGGRLPRSISSSNGHLDILKAIEVSSNPYFSLLAGEILNSPLDLAFAAREFSYGSRTGIDLPGEISGNIPNDLESNRTGLYSFAIGQHTLVVTPLQTAIMLASLANGGKIMKPKIVSMVVGNGAKEEHAPSIEKSPSYTQEVEEALKPLGIDFPVFDASIPQQHLTGMPVEIKREIFLPNVVREILIKGMCRVATRTRNSSLANFRRLYKHYPDIIKDYVALTSYLPGKTSTAESIENIDLDLNEGNNIYTHVWFGGIAYKKDLVNKSENHFLFCDALGNPELVIVVYLRYGGYGKEAAPVASQIAKKWKEIKTRLAP